MSAAVMAVGRSLRRAAGAVAALLLVATSAAAPPGTPIENRAEARFTGGAGPTTIYSNVVAVAVAPAPARAALALLRASDVGAAGISAATQCLLGGVPTELPPPLGSAGQTLALGAPVSLQTTAAVHGGEALFLELVDGDRNRDAAVLDAVELVVASRGGDRETIVLTETAVDSGRFFGYVQTRAAPVSLGDCILQVERDGEVTASYADPLDASDTATATALVDPYGLVFDSQTGAPIDGVRVRLVDAATGLPAVVLGDDGVSAHPAEIITGQAATDAGGTVYRYSAGTFRFPLVAPGEYRFVVEPPSGYAAPSTVPEARLQQLPGAPYALTAASFGGVLTVAGPFADTVDLPVDPSGSVLTLDKSTPLETAAVGDFIPYAVVVRNASDSAALDDVVVTDELPVGVRYQSGSARVEGGASIVPEIGLDGRTLTFRFARLEARQAITLRYVAVVANGASGRSLVNRVRASADRGIESNAASASVSLREELYSSVSLLVGRVFAGTCETTTEQGAGVGGVRVYLEDGRYAVTDDEGKYHFEGVTPGSHVVQIDTLTLPAEAVPLGCGTRVRSAGSATSQFVDLRGGALGRADFVLAHRAAPTGNALLKLSTEAIQGGFEHKVTIVAAGVPVQKAEVLALLPDALVYVPGSTRVDGVSSADPEEQTGSLRFALDGSIDDGARELAFSTRAAGTTAGDHTVQALMRFTTPLGRAERTAAAANVVQRAESRLERMSYTFSPRYNNYSFAPRFGPMQTAVDPRDRTELERVAAEWRGIGDLRIEVVGHSDRTPISARNRDRFPDNYALSAARARAVAEYLANALPEARIVVEGKGAEEPVDGGTSPEALARNRRVEIHVTGMRTRGAVEWRVVEPTAETAPVETTGVLEGDHRPVPRALESAHRAAVPSALEQELDVANIAPEIAMLQPSAGFAPPVPTVRVAISHLPGQRVELALNGRPVSALNYDGVEQNDAKTALLARWRGVDLREGDNALVAVVLDGNGAPVARLERTVRYGGGAVRAELAPEQSLLTADGRTQPVIALRVYDGAGSPARPGTLGSYRVDPPYRTWWEVETLRDNPALSVAGREPTFAVEDDGVVRILLEPTAQTGTAVVRLRFNERQEQEIRVRLTPEQRDWILVGLAENTAAYDRVSAGLLPPDVEEGYSSDGRLAFFAKGRIRGDTLMTIAFDSARDRALVEDRLFGTIEPDRYYTLYGDAVEQRFEAPTSRKLYLKIERSQLAVLFGDFETGLTITELSRYSRTLTGFKADFGGERFAVNAFAAENRERYGRDELRGDGTSGPYALSRGAIVANSDRLRIEVRDRVRSEVVVESRELARFLDYSIDYFTGTLLFKQPVASRDASFNPVYVVAEYETLDAVDGGTTAGARAARTWGGDKLEVGATLINEGSAIGDTRLAGADIRYKPTDALELRAETARTASADPLRPPDASAHLVELAHVTDRLDLTAYAREQADGFGLGQQRRTEAGTRKVGVDARTRVTERWTARGETFRQENLATGAERELVSAEARRETDDTTASVGLRRVVDDLPQTGVRRSELVSVGGSVDVLQDRVTLRALAERSLSAAAESLDFPERTTIGADYRVTGATTLFAEVEDSDGALLDATMTRVGVRSTPWTGSQVTSSVSRDLGEYGPRVLANVGLTQSWRLGEAWAMDFGIDRSDTLTSGVSLERVNDGVPPSVGTLDGDFHATFVGAQYRADDWTVTTRLERRSADSADRTSFLGGFFREPSGGRALSVTTRWLDNDADAGSGRLVDARLSYAYRPTDSRFIVFERLDLTADERDDVLGRFETKRVVNNVNLHWQVGQTFEVGTQIGARYAKSTIDGEAYSGWSTLLGLDTRRDLTRTLDVGLHATWLDSEAGGTTERSAGIDVGIAASRNLWISVGYNFAGFRDENFDASRYTMDGPYVKFRFKADQDFFKDLDLARLRPANR